LDPAFISVWRFSSLSRRSALSTGDVFRDRSFRFPTDLFAAAGFIVSVAIRIGMQRYLLIAGMASIAFLAVPLIGWAFPC
jgi:hypothetical protein